MSFLILQGEVPPLPLTIPTPRPPTPFSLFVLPSARTASRKESEREMTGILDAGVLPRCRKGTRGLPRSCPLLN